MLGVYFLTCEGLDYFGCRYPPVYSSSYILVYVKKPLRYPEIKHTEIYHVYSLAVPHARIYCTAYGSHCETVKRPGEGRPGKPFHMPGE